MDVQQFQTFYQEHLGLLYSYVYSKVRNREEAEDLTAHIFMKALDKLDSQRSVLSKRSWLFQVARTTIADYWRAFYRTPSASSLETLVDAGWEGPTEIVPDDLGSSSTERIQQILQALPARDREVLTCRFLLNLSLRETALRMGLSETNTKVVQYRALKRAAEIEGAVPETAS